MNKDKLEKELLKSCRYYKKGTQNYGSLVDIEKTWIFANLNDKEALSSFIDDYINSGLSSFSTFDETPISLKAILFNYYCKQSSVTMLENAEGFKKWYNTIYKKDQN